MSPLEHVLYYYEHVWTRHEVDLIPQLCANPVLRHDAKRDVALSHEEQRERILGHADKDLVFRIVLAHGDDTYATVIWEITSGSSDFKMAGIEVLKVVDGRIVENWTGLRDGLLWPG